jgi:predicted ATPase
MKESILIRNFGPISEVVIDDIKPLTIFIGESGSGKSTVLKLIAMFRWIYKRMCTRTFLRKSGKNQTFRFRLDTYLKNQEQTNFLRSDSYIEYRNGEICLVIENKKLRGTRTVVPMEQLCLEKIAFVADKRIVMSDLQAGNLAYRDNSFYLNETYGDYLQSTNSVKSLEMPYLNVRLDIRQTKNGILHRIVSMNNSDQKFDINLREASSGIQTTAPMAVITEYFATKYDLVEASNKSMLTYLSQSDNLSGYKFIANIGAYKYRRVTLCLEEPELGLFPNAQVGLIKFIVDRCFNTKHDYDMHALITTHSPYIFNYLNVLMAEHREGRTKLDGNDVAAYIILDGKANSLICKDELGNILIDTNDLTDEMVNIAREYNEVKGV